MANPNHDPDPNEYVDVCTNCGAHYVLTSTRLSRWYKRHGRSSVMPQRCWNCLGLGGIAMADNFVMCHCDLSGEVHIGPPDKSCEVCDRDRRVPFTPENVQEWFKRMRAYYESVKKAND